MPDSGKSNEFQMIWSLISSVQVVKNFRNKGLKTGWKLGIQFMEILAIKH